MRIFVDANVLFSALHADGAIRKLVVRLKQEGHDLLADEYVMSEAQRNLTIKVPHTKPWDISMSIDVRPTANSALPNHVPLDEKDRQVLASAIALRCNALVTGDRAHFSHLFGKDVGGVSVHSPRSLAELLLPQG